MSSVTLRRSPGRGRAATSAEAKLVLAAAAVRASARRRAWRRIAVWAARFALIAALLAFWQVAATVWVGSPNYSRPSDVGHRLVEWFTSGTVLGPIWTQISTTLQETVVGFVIGATAGLTAGVLLGRRKFMASVLAPFIRAANAVPRIVLASLFIIMFGLGIPSKIATAVFMVFFAVFFEAFRATRDIDSARIQEAYLMGATRGQSMRYVVLPSAAPRMLASLHSAFSFALTGAIVSEYIGGSRGLGVLIHDSQATFDVAGIYAGMLIATVIALVAEWVVFAVERRLTVINR